MLRTIKSGTALMLLRHYAVLLTVIHSHLCVHNNYIAMCTLAAVVMHVFIVLIMHSGLGNLPDII